MELRLPSAQRPQSARPESARPKSARPQSARPQSARSELLDTFVKAAVLFAPSPIRTLHIPDEGLPAPAPPPTRLADCCSAATSALRLRRPRTSTARPQAPRQARPVPEPALEEPEKTQETENPECASGQSELQGSQQGQQSRRELRVSRAISRLLEAQTEEPPALEAAADAAAGAAADAAADGEDNAGKVVAKAARSWRKLRDVAVVTKLIHNTRIQERLRKFDERWMQIVTTPKEQADSGVVSNAAKLRQRATQDDLLQGEQIEEQGYSIIRWSSQDAVLPAASLTEVGGQWSSNRARIKNEWITFEMSTMATVAAIELTLLETRASPKTCMLQFSEASADGPWSDAWGFTTHPPPKGRIGLFYARHVYGQDAQNNFIAKLMEFCGFNLAEARRILGDDGSPISHNLNKEGLRQAIQRLLQDRSPLAEEAAKAGEIFLKVFQEVVLDPRGHVSIGALISGEHNVRPPKAPWWRLMMVNNHGEQSRVSLGAPLRMYSVVSTGGLDLKKMKPMVRKNQQGTLDQMGDMLASLAEASGIHVEPLDRMKKRVADKYGMPPAEVDSMIEQFKKHDHKPKGDKGPPELPSLFKEEFDQLMYALHGAKPGEVPPGKLDYFWRRIEKLHSEVVAFEEFLPLYLSLKDVIQEFADRLVKQRLMRRGHHSGSGQKHALDGLTRYSSVGHALHARSQLLSEGELDEELPRSTKTMPAVNSGGVQPSIADMNFVDSLHPLQTLSVPHMPQGQERRKSATLFNLGIPTSPSANNSLQLPQASPERRKSAVLLNLEGALLAQERDERSSSSYMLKLKPTGALLGGRPVAQERRTSTDGVGEMARRTSTGGRRSSQDGVIELDKAAVNTVIRGGFGGGVFSGPRRRSSFKQSEELVLLGPKQSGPLAGDSSPESSDTRGSSKGKRGTARGSTARGSTARRSTARGFMGRGSVTRGSLSRSSFKPSEAIVIFPQAETRGLTRPISESEANSLLETADTWKESLVMNRPVSQPSQFARGVSQ